MESEKESKQEIAITPINRPIVRPIFIYGSIIVIAFAIGFFGIAPEKFLSSLEKNINIVTTFLISVTPTKVPPTPTITSTPTATPTTIPTKTPTPIPTKVPCNGSCINSDECGLSCPICSYTTCLPTCNEAESINNAKNCTSYILVETDNRSEQGDGFTQYTISKHGSGFSPQSGYIVTNFHVIENANRINTYINGKKENLMVWGTSENDDLAVLKLNTPVPTCKWSNSQTLSPAETVYAVGWPLDSTGESTITKGRFYQTSKTLNEPEFIQVNAITKPGNSGGPLINKCGVVGVNTAGETLLQSVIGHDINTGKVSWSSQVNEELSLAISSNYAVPIINNLIQNGSVKALPIKAITPD